MALPTPDAAAAKWAANLSAAQPRIQAGIQAVSVAPGQAAARQSAVWATNVAAAQQKFATNVAAVTLSEWQTAAITKGLPRVASGAQAAQPKFTTFMGKLLPYIASGKGQLPARGGLEANIARSANWARYMAKFTK